MCSYNTVWAHSRQILQVSRGLISKTRAHAERWLKIKFDEIEPVRLAPAMTTGLLVIHDRADREAPIEESEKPVRVWPGARLVATEKLGHTRILRDPEVARQAAGFIAGA